VGKLVAHALASLQERECVRLDAPAQEMEHVAKLEVFHLIDRIGSTGP
jgi:hypothetical protein